MNRVKHQQSMKRNISWKHGQWKEHQKNTDDVIQTVQTTSTSHRLYVLAEKAAEGGEPPNGGTIINSTASTAPAGEHIDTVIDIMLDCGQVVDLFV
jgi:hypothetical protein